MERVPGVNCFLADIDKHPQQSMASSLFENYTVLQWYSFCKTPTGILCQEGGGGSWVVAETGDLWWGAPHKTHYYYNYYYLRIQSHSTEWVKKLISPSFAGIGIFIANWQLATNTLYLCVEIVWLFDDCNWHEAPWKPALFTSKLEVGSA